eukprot:gene12482-biopygen19956
MAVDASQRGCFSKGTRPFLPGHAFRANTEFTKYLPCPQGETATPASGPRPVRVRFFKFYRAPRVRSASGPRPLPFS